MSRAQIRNPSLPVKNKATQKMKQQIQNKQTKPNQDACQSCYWESFKLKTDAHLLHKTLLITCKVHETLRHQESKALTDSCEGLERITLLVSKSVTQEKWFCCCSCSSSFWILSPPKSCTSKLHQMREVGKKARSMRDLSPGPSSLLYSSSQSCVLPQRGKI